MRSAILLGAVLPEMRHEMELLQASLAELERAAQGNRRERERLDRDLKMLADEGLRLTMLTEQRQKQQEIEKALRPQRERARPRRNRPTTCRI